MSKPYLSSRRPISPTEATVLKDLKMSWSRDRIESIRGGILQGSLDISSVACGNPLIMYETGGGDGTDACEAKYALTPEHWRLQGTNSPISETQRILSVLQADEQSLDELHRHGQPSHFGRGNELVRDESYRLAQELPAERFGLNFDPLAPETGILDAISREVSPSHNGSALVEAKLYKLNSYKTGGHFKSHKDTPKGREHSGTLLIGFPTNYTGGQLVLRHYMQEVSVDWSTDGRSNRCRTDIPWVFFYSHIEHEIMPVTSGHRITIAYDIYESNAVRRFIPSQLQAKLDVSSRPVFQDLKSKVLEAKDFRPEGGRLAFPSTREYPMPVVQRSVHLIDMLKGSDHILVHAARQFGIPVSIKAVYKQIDDLADHSNSPPSDSEDTLPDIPDSVFKFNVSPGAEPSERYPTDKYSSYDPRTGKNHFTSSTFGEDLPESVSLDLDEPRAKFQMILEHRDLELEMDLIWVDEPHYFTETSTFTSYGNEPSSDHIYVSAVIILGIPPYGAGCRSEPKASS
ncbi:hypothetical protein FRC01_001218 [Tulasnella sp. 417]|nr:hypothetical protein FRC01_001218 [Tulasnella sp. 417]